MPQIPPRSAGVEEIRTYIRQTLKSTYHTDEKLAEEAALSWRIGRGSELQDLSLDYFQRVFGVDIGLCIFRSVVGDQYAAWERSLFGIVCTSVYFTSALLLLVSHTGAALGLRFIPPFPSPLSPPFSGLVFGVCSTAYGYLRPKVNQYLVICGIISFCSALVTIFSQIL
ncbi:hypothetical protein BJX70DRAFT_358951 [Aspergillus crustosus]